MLGRLFAELRGVFGDSDYLHVGFDEAHWDCYDVPHVNAWMATVGIRAGDHKGVLRWMRYGPVGETDQEFARALEDALR